MDLRINNGNCNGNINKLKLFNSNNEKTVVNPKEDEKSEAKGAKTPPIEKETVYEGVELLNNAMNMFNHKLHFEVHEDTNRIKVAIVDKATNELIKEIPPQEVLDMLAKIQDMLGILVDKKI